MNIPVRLVVLWVLLIIGMILHFNYHVSEIFYGIDVVRPGANGTMPISALVIKTIYYHLPMLYVVALLYFQQKGFRLAAFVVGLVYTLSHLVHLSKELVHDPKGTPEITQVNLLLLVLAISTLMNWESWKWWKSVD